MPGSPARLNPVFVLASSRSGSTLVQRVLNIHADLTVWGEHNGFLNPLSRAYGLLTDDTTHRKLISDGSLERDLLIGPLADPQRFIAWTNPMSPEEYRGQFRELLIEIFARELPPTVRWGFKEIRYGREVARFLLDLFPRARFVFPARDLIGHLRSRVLTFEQPWDLNDEESESKLAETLTRFANQWLNRHEDLRMFCENNPGTSFTLASTDLADPAVANSVFANLGLDPVPEGEIEAVTTRVSGSFKEDRWSDGQMDQLSAAIEKLTAGFDHNANQKVERISEFFHL